jgi:hypothetical protein
MEWALIDKSTLLIFHFCSKRSNEIVRIWQSPPLDRSADDTAWATERAFSVKSQELFDSPTE